MPKEKSLEIIKSVKIIKYQWKILKLQKRESEYTNEEIFL